VQHFKAKRPAWRVSDAPPTAKQGGSRAVSEHPEILQGGIRGLTQAEGDAGATAREPGLVDKPAHPHGGRPVEKFSGGVRLERV